MTSLATLETLPQPSKGDVERMVMQYPTGERENRLKISPLTSPEHWKSLRRVSRQKRLADSLPVGKFGKHALVSQALQMFGDRLANMRSRDSSGLVGTLLPTRAAIVFLPTSIRTEISKPRCSYFAPLQSELSSVPQ